MNFIDRIQSLSERANSQRSLEERRAESERLQHLLEEAETLSAVLVVEVEQLRLLRDQDIGVSAPDTTAAARKTLGRLRERFANKRRAEQLTKGQDWNRFHEQVHRTSQDLSSALNTKWRQFVETAFSGDKPRNLESTLARTPLNVENLRQFRDAYSKLEGLLGSHPTRREDFEYVRKLARQLSEIYQNFDFDVPEDVKSFLRAVADGGADLALLTTCVRDWLDEQGTNGDYRIVARLNTQ